MIMSVSSSRVAVFVYSNRRSSEKTLYGPSYPKIRPYGGPEEAIPALDERGGGRGGWLTSQPRDLKRNPAGRAKDNFSGNSILLEYGTYFVSIAGKGYFFFIQAWDISGMVRGERGKCPKWPQALRFVWESCARGKTGTSYKRTRGRGWESFRLSSLTPNPPRLL